MIEGTFWQEKLENITVGPRENLIVLWKNLLYLFRVLWFANYMHINYVIESSHLPGEVVKIDIIFDQRQESKAQ